MPDEGIEQDKEKRMFLAQTKLDEAVYELLELGWSDQDIIEKVDDTIEQFEGGDENE
jgi:DNA-binding transcriptional regulator YhcF (GntR family)